MLIDHHEGSAFLPDTLEDVEGGRVHLACALQAEASLETGQQLREPRGVRRAERPQFALDQRGIGFPPHLASALYHVVTLAGLRWEAARDGLAGRALLADLVLAHRLAPRDPLTDNGVENDPRYLALLAHAPESL